MHFVESLIEVSPRPSYAIIACMLCMISIFKGTPLDFAPRLETLDQSALGAGPGEAQSRVRVGVESDLVTLTNKCYQMVSEMEKTKVKFKFTRSLFHNHVLI